LRIGQSSEPIEHRRTKLVQRRERQLHLGFHSGCAHHPESGRRTSDVLHERRLADSSVASDHDRCANARARAFEQPVHAGTLCLAIDHGAG
jgi:hypothetical protein